ncbi:PilT protein domain protein [Halalkaliarchaeum desulfuricum]|uniref:PilT protein domain protein n=1 Tax=Halalkaliarchaeum desulfuricum TaxID=2055893 RepID=A0A343TNR7_9EURY|nr:hypothetical protein [Halalkaliarchaeum desulfuricum]AUX10739.1 PilT protein domain protein [Halalkaliarchaeum desulfuricum]
MRVLDTNFLIDYLDGVDTLVAAVGQTVDAPIVSTDGDLTHDATKRVVHVEEYRR